ncbi:MAG: hypothetical protein NC123_08530, partial [Butyrivibrio sp.]|nr:hypothetical protein [Butyrivibrio sp.]
LPLFALFAFSVRVNAAGSNFNIKDFEKFDSDSLYGKAYGFSLRFGDSGSLNGNDTISITEFSIVSDRPIFAYLLYDVPSTNGPMMGYKLCYLKEDGTVAYLNGGEDAGAVCSTYDWTCRKVSDGSLVNSSHYETVMHDFTPLIAIFVTSTLPIQQIFALASASHGFFTPLLRHTHSRFLPKIL